MLWGARLSYQLAGMNFYLRVNRWMLEQTQPWSTGAWTHSSLSRILNTLVMRPLPLPLSLHLPPRSPSIGATFNSLLSGHPAVPLGEMSALNKVHLQRNRWVWTSETTASSTLGRCLPYTCSGVSLERVDCGIPLDRKLHSTTGDPCRYSAFTHNCLALTVIAEKSTTDRSSTHSWPGFKARQFGLLVIV